MNQQKQSSDLFVSFLEQVRQSLADEERESTITDLRVELGAERLTEISEWSRDDLDEVEQVANTFEKDMRITELLASPPSAIAGPPAIVPLYGSPSPVAWV